MFDDFVLHAVSDGKTDFEYRSKHDAQQVLTQFNLEIDSVIHQYGIERAGIAVWYCYGCVSGMIGNVLDNSISAGWSAFYESMMNLYENGFARHLENQFDHPLRQSRLGTSCYMLWDMDGIEYLSFERTESQRKMVEPLIDFGLAHQHVSVQESFLHGLGHRIGSHSAWLQPKLAKFLKRRDLQPEIRSYARRCQTGMVL